MARKVYISSAMWADERLLDLGDTNDQAVMMWPWLLTLFDDWGRAELAPRSIQKTVFAAVPTITKDIVLATVHALAEVGIVELYEVNGKSYFAVPYPKWIKYQTHIRRDKRVKDDSKFPAQPSYKACLDVVECAQKRENNSESTIVTDIVVQTHNNAQQCTPSPSSLPPIHPSSYPPFLPSLSPSDSERAPDEPVVEPEPVCETVPSAKGAFDRLGFEFFWGAFPQPKRTMPNKAAAIVQWDLLRPGSEEQKQINACVAEMSKSEQWTEQHCRYLPRPGAFLESKLWRVVPATPKLTGLAQTQAEHMAHLKTVRERYAAVGIIRGTVQ